MERVPEDVEGGALLGYLVGMVLAIVLAMFNGVTVIDGSTAVAIAAILV